MLRDAWRRFHDLVVRLEELPWGPGRTFALFAGIVAVRTLLEIMVARNPVFPGLAAFVHYPLAYLAPALALALVLAAFSGVAPARVARLMALAWLLTLAPPVLDLLLHRGSEIPTIGYLVADPADLGWTLAHFFDPRVSLPGTTPGIRLEALAAALLGALYVFLRSGSRLRAIFSAPVIFLVSFLFFALPVLVEAVFRHVLPRLDTDGFRHGEGILWRGPAEVRFDALAITWLVPLLVVIGAAWSRLERRHAERWLATPGQARLASRWPPLAWVLGGTVLAGEVAGFLLWFPPSGPMPPVAAWDFLGTGGAVLAVPLLLAGLSLAGSGAGRVPGIALLGGGGTLLAALGRGPAVGLLATAGALAPFLLGIEPRGTAGRRVALALPLPLASLGALAAGFCLVIGPDGLARMPGVLVGAVLAWGLLAGPAALLGAELAPGPRTRSLVPAVLAVAGILLAMGLLARPAVRGPLRERVRHVARLSRIRGEEALREGKLNLARTRFREALRTNPEDAVAWRQLGLVYVRKGRFDKARECFRRAVDLAPRDPAALENLASVLLREGEPDKALALLDRALAVAPRDVVALFNRARALDDLGRSGAAREAWRAYLAIATGRPGEADSVRQARRRLRVLSRRAPAR